MKCSKPCQHDMSCCEMYQVRSVTISILFWIIQMSFFGWCFLKSISLPSTDNLISHDLKWHPHMWQDYWLSTNLRSTIYLEFVMTNGIKQQMEVTNKEVNNKTQRKIRKDKKISRWLLIIKNQQSDKKKGPQAITQGISKINAYKLYMNM